MKTPPTIGGPLVLALACLATAAGCGEQTDTRPATWSYISTAIVQPSCATANCHSNLSQRSGVDLGEIREGYAQLVGRHFVLSERPQTSALIALLKGSGTRRMPPDFALADDDIDLISRWITNGAPYDGPGSAPVVPVPAPLTAGGN
ncbi:MAG: hypothetical protein H7X95_02200 [Deltaproteobacteria bacterium]|nr:hypothetical protein [Deltaproteobacteria bacterium]